METSKPSFRSAVITGGCTMIGVLLAMTLSRYDYSFIGWLLGGAIMGVGIMYAYVASQKRSVLKWMYVLTVPGVVSGIIYNLLD